MEYALRKQIDALLMRLRDQHLDPASAAAQAIAEVSKQEFVQHIMDAARPFIQRAVQTGGTAGASNLPGSIGFGFDVFNPEVQRFIDEYSVRLARAVNEYTVVRAKDILGEGLKEGEGVQELIQRVKDWAGEVGDAERGIGYRAENIARTESARAQMSGVEEAWKQSGVVIGKVWQKAADCCIYCEAAAALFNQTHTALGRPFAAQGTVLTAKDGSTMTLDYSDIDGPPLHPSCRCNILPVLEGEQ